MTRTTALLLSLTLFGGLFICMALWASRRTHNALDFVLGSRRAAIWLTALSYSANAFNASMLLLFAAAAFAWGIAAAWIWLAAVLGHFINTFYVAPRVRILSIAQGSVTPLQVLTADVGERMHRLVSWSAALMLLSSLLLQTGAQLHAVAIALSGNFGVDPGLVITLSVALVVWCTLLGGYWSASANDVVQGILMLGVTLFLPLIALAAAGGWLELWNGFAALGAEASDPFGGKTGVVALAFASGVLGIGLAATGQPHAVSRFMAARDEPTLRAARWLAMLWIAVLSAAALLCGWSAKVLYAGLSDPGQALFALGSRALPPAAGAVITFTLVSAILGSIGSQFLACASSMAVELKRGTAPLSLPWLRVALVAFAIVAACVAHFAPVRFLEYTLFSFTAMGAAFGPLLLVRLSGKRVRPGSTLGAMWAGFTLTALFHLLPDAPGDFLERVLPFVAALGIALSGGERRLNPDRADRAQETMHDRVPI